MIVPETEKTLISSGLGNQVNYKILANSKMMNILSNNIYSNKVRAVMRELSTNAHDSHIAANKADIPFDVWLPSKVEKTFKIRDYGTGLSPENVIDLYSTYGSSDKTDSNSFVGFMGLGSKSPFALVSSFYTISYFNGRKYTFLNFKNEQDIPTISMVSDTETNEQNGLEISFFVKNEDLDKFIQERDFVFCPFETTPNIWVTELNAWISGLQKSTPGRKIERITNNGFEYVFFTKAKSTKISYYDPPVQFYVKMGNVLYELTDTSLVMPLNSTQKFSVALYNHLTGTISNYEQIDIVIELPIGSIDVATSREQVQLTERTKKAIFSYIKAILVSRTKELLEIKENNKLSVFDKSIKFLSMPDVCICTNDQVISKYFSDKLKQTDFVDKHVSVRFDSKDMKHYRNYNGNTCVQMQTLKVFHNPNKNRNFISYFSKTHFEISFYYRNFAEWLKKPLTNEDRQLLVLIKDQARYMNQVNFLKNTYSHVGVVDTKEEAQTIKDTCEKHNFNYVVIKKASEIIVPIEEKTISNIPKQPAKKRGYLVYDSMTKVKSERFEDPNVEFKDKVVYYLVYDGPNFYDTFELTTKLGNVPDSLYFIGNNFEEIAEQLEKNVTKPKTISRKIVLLSPVWGASFLQKHSGIEFHNLVPTLQQYSKPARRLKITENILSSVFEYNFFSNRELINEILKESLNSTKNSSQKSKIKFWMNLLTDFQSWKKDKIAEIIKNNSNFLWKNEIDHDAEYKERNDAITNKGIPEIKEKLLKITNLKSDLNNLKNRHKFDEQKINSIFEDLRKELK